MQLRSDEISVETFGMIERVDASGSVRVLPSGLISREDFAAYVGRSARTIAQWAWSKRGPRPISVGGRSYYDWAEVQRFARGGAGDSPAHSEPAAA